jgi:hypothetical protein
LRRKRLTISVLRVFEKKEDIDVSVINISDRRYKAAKDLLDAALEFWDACNDAGQYGAVQWLEGSGGELLVFTRGEYRQHIMSNISTLPNVDEINFFRESMEIAKEVE